MKKMSFFVLGFCVLFLLSGCDSTKSKEAEPSRSVSLTSEVSSSHSSESTESQSSSTTDASSTVSTTATTDSSQKVQFTARQKGAINQAFLDWAGGRAAIGNMAVSHWFFDHGAAGRGDWYANTPDGQVQVQNNGVPGEKAFPIHALGGCVFYTSKDGSIGKQELMAGSFAANYSVKMDYSKPVSKYLLGDNGVVYELKTGNGEPVSTNTGFGEYADDGSLGSYTPNRSFQISEDQAAQEKLRELIYSY